MRFLHGKTRSRCRIACFVLAVFVLQLVLVAGVPLAAYADQEAGATQIAAGSEAGGQADPGEDEATNDGDASQVEEAGAKESASNREPSGANQAEESEGTTIEGDDVKGDDSQSSVSPEDSGSEEPAEESIDVTSYLIGIQKSVTQNGSTITENGKLQFDKPIKAEVEFKVPVKGDYPDESDPDKIVQQNDYAIFKLSDAFKLIGGNKPIGMKHQGTLVGTVHFSTEEGMVQAKVVFDGDDEIFCGDISDVTCEFSIELEYDNSGNAGGEGEHEVTILGKTYTVVVPAIPVEYEMKKSGEADEADLSKQIIKWTVEVTASQGDKAYDLCGYQFHDDLAEVGEYVADSFEVNDNFIGDDDHNFDSGELSYTFPEGSVSPQTITFETKIPNDAYYTQTKKTVTNTVKLLDDEGNIKAEKEAKAGFTPLWIEKKVNRAIRVAQVNITLRIALSLGPSRPIIMGQP